MIKKILNSILITCIITLSLTGCWDRRELNDLGIVVAIGLDKDTETGNILLTSQIVRPALLEKNSSGGNESPYEIVITSGVTIFEAIRNTVKEFDRRSFFSHVKVIVVNEDIAREGLNDVIDFISRSHEIRKSSWLIVSSGSKAQDILGIKHGIEKLQANYIQGIIKREKISPNATTSSVMDFIKKMPGEVIHPVTGVFKIIDVKSIPPEGTGSQQKQGLTLTGSAVFKKDKLVGFLNEEEALGLNILSGNKKDVPIHVPSPQNKTKDICIDINKIKPSIKPVIEGNKISFNIVIKAEGNITEVQDNFDISNLTNFERVNVEFSQYIEDKVKITLKKIQGDLKVDAVGFGNSLQQKYPKYWNGIKGQWDTIFPKVSFIITIDSSLKRTGLSLKPINAKKSDK
jgi:spore germination protein KC